MEKCPIIHDAVVALFVWVSYGALVNDACAGARRFTSVYEAPTAAPGSVESENWSRGALAHAKSRVSMRSISGMRLSLALQSTYSPISPTGVTSETLWQVSMGFAINLRRSEQAHIRPRLLLSESRSGHDPRSFLEAW